MVEMEKVKEIAGEVRDFGQALIHQALESPVNGITQVVNHTVGTNIPELQIVGEVKNPSTGAKLGSIAGGVIDYYVLSKLAGPALGNLGGSGTVGNALRGGIVGGVYSGLLTPTDASSSKFFSDRFSNGMVGAAGFAGMSAAGSYLSSKGIFAVPEVRSLGGSITFGALSGAAGGIAQSEAEAIFKKGKVLPSVEDLATNTLSMAAFGAAFGAVDYSYNKFIAPPKVTEVKSTFVPEEGSGASLYNSKDGEALTLRLIHNKNGELVRMRAELPAMNDFDHIGWQATRMTDGSWSNKAMSVFDGKWKSSYTEISLPALQNVSTQPDGTVKIISSDGRTRVFAPNGKYERVETNPRPQPVVDPNYSELNMGNNSKVVYLRSNTGGTELGSRLHIDSSGKVSEVSFSNTGDQLFMRKNADGTWKMYSGVTPDGKTAPSDYMWKGEVEAVRSAAGKVESLQFKFPDGHTVSMPKTLDNAADLAKALHDTGSFLNFDKNFRYLRTDADGNMFLKTQSATLNGKPVADAEVPIKPMDDVRIVFDIGDRYSILKDYFIGWSKTDSGFRINKTEIKPDSIYDLNRLLNVGY